MTPRQDALPVYESVKRKPMTSGKDNDQETVKKAVKKLRFHVSGKDVKAGGIVVKVNDMRTINWKTLKVIEWECRAVSRYLYFRIKPIFIS